MNSSTSEDLAMKIERPANCSQDGDDVVNSKASSTSNGTLSDLNEESNWTEHGKEDGDGEFSLDGYKTLSKHSGIDAIGAKSSIEMNCLNDPNDGEGSEYSPLKNDFDMANLEQKCKVNNGSDDGINTSEQPKAKSSSSDPAKFVLPASSNDSYQGSVIGARILKGTSTTNANSSSMSSTCTDSGYHHKEIHVSIVESVTTKESEQLKEKLTDASETNTSKARSSELAEKLVSDINLDADRGKGHLNMAEHSALSGIDLNEDTTNSNEVEQQTATCCVKNLRKPIAVFARCEGPICESTPEVGFKGLTKGGWQGSASTTSAFRPTCYYSKGSDSSGQRRFTEIDLNVEASEMLNEKECLEQKVFSEEASSTREKFDIDLNISSENDGFQSSRTVRDFNLNDVPIAPDLNVQSVEQSFRKEAMEAMHERETCFLRVAREPEPRYMGPVVLPHMTSLPFVFRFPEQAENTGRDYPFHTPHLIETPNHVFSLASSPHVPFYPAHLNGVPAFHGVPGLVEFSSGLASNSMVKVVPPYNQYEGMNPLGSTSSRGTGMQLFATPMHPIVPQQMNDFDFRRGALPSLTPMKRREPETRWSSH
ncbi:hypothetical protein SAY86_019714 [Trapa natans]|uniref:Uncharacterized protein n=1 Tax=Trapa natans TaxID=22666 RepID=A0AAN7LZA7_TRANT|nr:hypothetical protein SAY86_019714 [Trapa natans]